MLKQLRAPDAALGCRNLESYPRDPALYGRLLSCVGGDGVIGLGRPRQRHLWSVVRAMRAESAVSLGSPGLVGASRVCSLCIFYFRKQRGTSFILQAGAENTDSGVQLACSLRQGTVASTGPGTGKLPDTYKDILSGIFLLVKSQYLLSAGGNNRCNRKVQLLAKEHVFGRLFGSCAQPGD